MDMGPWLDINTKIHNVVEAFSELRHVLGVYHDCYQPDPEWQRLLPELDDWREKCLVQANTFVDAIPPEISGLADTANEFAGEGGP